LEIVAISGSTSIRGGFSASSSMILKVEALVDGLENFFSKGFL